MSIVGFVMFKDTKGQPRDSLGVYAVFGNGLIRWATPIEFYELRAPGQVYEKVPIRRELETQLARYQEYDTALRS